MLLDPIPGQPVNGSLASERSQQKRLSPCRKLVAQVVTVMLAVLLPSAYASPPDPTWIAGIYDSADYDDVVGLVTDGTAASSSQALARVELGVVAYVPVAKPGAVPNLTLASLSIWVRQ